MKRFWGRNLPESGSRTQRASLTAISALLVQLARVVAVFLAVPIVAQGLGPALFGVWRMIQQATAYFAVEGLSGVGALKWTLAKEIHSDDFEAKRRQIGSVLRIWVFVFLLVMAIGAPLAWVFPGLVEIEPSHRNAALVGTGIMVFDMALLTLVTLPGAVLRGMNFAYRAMPADVMGAVLPALLSAGAVLLGWGLIGVTSAYLVSTLLTGALRWWIAKWTLPWLGTSRPREGQARKMLGISVWFEIWTFVVRLLTSSDLIVVGLMLSPALAGYYSLTNFAYLSMIGPIKAVVSSVMPGVGDLVGRGEWEMVASVRRHGRHVVWLVVTTFACVGVAFNGVFLEHWIGPEVYAGAWVNLGLAVVTVLHILMVFDANIIDTTVDIVRKTIIGFLAALSTVGLALLLVPRLGMLGMVAAAIIGRAALGFYYQRLVREKIRSTQERLKEISLRPVAVAAVMLAVAFSIEGRIHIEGWLALVPAVGVAAAVASVIYWWAGIPAPVRASLRSRAVGLLRR